jgi:hypothetical protein
MVSKIEATSLLALVQGHEGPVFYASLLAGRTLNVTSK